MHPDAFAQLRPFAYHLTARANLPAIERTRRLDPAAAIFARANRQDLLCNRRPRRLGRVSFVWLNHIWSLRE